MFWTDYTPNDAYDELLTSSGEPRESVRRLGELLGTLGLDELRARQRAANANIRARGITFTVYSQKNNMLERRMHVGANGAFRSPAMRVGPR